MPTSLLESDAVFAPEVTVVVPTRNRRDWLARTVGAVLAQPVDLEVIIVDEATDASDALALLAELPSDPRVRVVRHDRPRGVAGAYNGGLALARGRWVAFCDDDDTWAPDKLPRQLAALAADPTAGWCVSGCVDVAADGITVLDCIRPPATEDLYGQLLERYVIPAARSGVVVSRSLLDELGPFDESMYLKDDWDMWLRLAAASTAVAVDAPLVAYRRHGTSMVHSAYRRDPRASGFEAAYRQARIDAGVSFDVRTDMLHKLSFLALESGLRRQALRDYLRLGARVRQPRLALVGVAAAVAPARTLARYRRRVLQRAPASYLREAADWLPTVPAVSPTGQAVG